ncbi:MAG TPA: hypothetical protein ENG29_01995 [Firmicutes bacterium]|nr:MAG: hypothetical protein DRH44_01650 [Candidatus Coatesbacteria bacterium]HDM43143.1 hypothetical protein [Bacillota bacterium]
MRIIGLMLLLPSLLIANILLVDDDGSNGGSYADVKDYYTNALLSNDYSYDYYEVPYNSNGPSQAMLSRFSTVVWFTGQTFGSGFCTTLTVPDENNLSTYLSNGGHLMLISQSYLSDRYPGAGDFHSGQFPYDVLQLRSAISDYWINPPFAWGANGSIAQDMTFTTNNPYNTPGRIKPDLLTHSAITLINNTSQTQGPSSLQYTSTKYKLIFMTMPFEGLEDADNRAELMLRIMEYFGEPKNDVSISSFGELKALFH